MRCLIGTLTLLTLLITGCVESTSPDESIETADPPAPIAPEVVAPEAKTPKAKVPAVAPTPPMSLMRGPVQS